MKITFDLLNKYGGAAEWKQFLTKCYPNGVEFEDAALDAYMTDSMLHFARRYFPLDKEDIKVYESMMFIYDTTNYNSSSYLEESKFVYNSDHVYESIYVDSSHDIESSDHIYFSKHIDNSNEVFQSKHVESSGRVLLSKHIQNATEILRSDHVTWSRNILNSSCVDESSYIYNSSNLIDCFFGGFLTNCSNCICCSNIHDAQYHIFNQPVDIKTYEKIHDLVTYKLENECSTFIIVNSAAVVPNERYVYSNRFDTIFDGLSADFYGWIGTLPNYNEDLFLQIFMSNKNLKNS